MYIQVAADSIPRTVSCVVDGCMGTTLQISSPQNAFLQLSCRMLQNCVTKNQPAAVKIRMGWENIFPISNFYNFVCLRNLVPQIKNHFLAMPEYLFQVSQWFHCDTSNLCPHSTLKYWTAGSSLCLPQDKRQIQNCPEMVYYMALAHWYYSN